MNWYRKFIVSEKIQDGDEDFSWVRVDIPEEIKRVHALVTNEIDITEWRGASYGVLTPVDSPTT